METLFTSINVWMIAKIFVLIVLGMYLIFSLVVVKQVKMMVSTLQIGFEGLAKTLSWLHLGFAVLVFITALVIL
jgi:hypothetical protein